MKTVLIGFATALAVVLGSAPAALAHSDNSSNNQWSPGGDGCCEWGPQSGYGRQGPWMMNPHARWMMGGGPGWMMGRGGGMMGRMGNMRGAMGHRQGAERGAHFRFVRGDDRIDIQCPANRSMEDCVDAAGTLIDKLAKLHRQGPPPPPKPHGPGMRGPGMHGPDGQGLGAHEPDAQGPGAQGPGANGPDGPGPGGPGAQKP